MVPESAKNPDLAWLRPKQQRAAVLLARTGDEEATAKALHVAARTVRGWRLKPLFRDALRSEGVLFAEEVRGKFREGVDVALSALRTIIANPLAKDGDKVKAALGWIDRALDQQGAPAVAVSIATTGPTLVQIDGKAPAQLTNEELAAIIAEGEEPKKIECKVEPKEEAQE